MTIGENKTIEVTVTVPTYSVSRFLFDVELPNDGQTACMTVIDVTVTSTVGANIPCFAPDSNKGISFAPNYTSALGTSQMTNGYQDLGIITNTGTVMGAVYNVEIMSLQKLKSEIFFMFNICLSRIFY